LSFYLIQKTDGEVDGEKNVHYFRFLNLGRRKFFDQRSETEIVSESFIIWIRSSQPQLRTASN